MTLPNNTIFEFYEGTETSEYTELNSTTLNTAPNQLLENDKYLDQEVQSLKESIEGGEIELLPTQLPKASETQQGIIEIATQEEVSEGRSNTTAVTPAYNKAFVDTQVNRAKQEAKDEILKEIGPVVDEKVEVAVGKVQDEIDNKIDQAVDTAKDSFTDSMQDSIDQAIQDKIESGEFGGGDSSLVVTPTLLAPAEGDVNVSTVPTLKATAYLNVLESDPRLYRSFEVVNTANSEKVVSQQANADEFKVTTPLSLGGKYKWRCRDTSTKGLKSGWTKYATFSVATDIYVETPTLTIVGSVTNVMETPSFNTGALAIVPDQGNSASQHQSSSWTLVSTEDDSVVWESKNDTTNKTSLTLPRGFLKPNLSYIMKVTHNSTNYGSSASGVVFFTCASQFTHVAQPTITIDGGTVNVGETPILRGSAFTIEPSGSDTHELTDWEILPQAGGAAVWQSLNDATNKTTIKVPKSRLEVSTAYIARVRYKGLNYGWSDWQSVQFNTAAVFALVNTPSLTVAGAPNAVAEQPALTLSAFGGTNVTYKNSHFKILKNADNSKVWETTSTSLSVKVPRSTLKVSTAYKFQGWHESNEGVLSQVAEVVATTVAEFSPVAAPDIVVEQDELGVYEAPLITATAFINESGLDNDEHSATDWVVLNASDGTEVWSSKSDRGHLRAIQMPNGKLQPNTTYRVQVRYQAYISGWGPWNEVEVTTQETFYKVNMPTLQNANIDRAGTQLRFEFSTDQLYVRPGKPRPTHLRVKVRNNTKADFVDTFTTPINNQGNYILLRDTTYDLDAADDIEYQVFYKGDASENDDNPYSATATRPATVNENLLVLLESISGGQHHVYQYPTITISLNYGPQTFTHTKTDWQIRDVADSTTIWSSMSDTTNLTKIKCPIKLDRQTFYTLKIKAYGTRDTDQNAESIEFVMTILTSAGGDIGVPGQMGFGIGLYDGEDLEQLGLTLMEGGADPNNDNYGNYQHTNGSVFCFVPAFCYSFTDEDANLSSKGTPNAFYVRSFTEFEDEADAKSKGYTLHRAFIDGGQTKKGFFITKYLMGKGCKATKGNIPISLISTGSSDASSQAEGGTGQAWDALTLSKKLGSQYNCASCFMYSALAMLSYCHGLYAETTDTCAWYDAAQTTNFPKGCNNNALGDTNDTSVKYTNSDTKLNQKPNTGSATPFAKTTHNGQNSGVCDLNGCMWQATTGVLLYNATLYLSPDSAKFTDFTKDNVQTTGNTALYTNLGNVSTYYKNGNWGVAGQCSFRKEDSGVQRALNGVLPLPAGTGSGTNEFGSDQAYLDTYSDGRYSALWCSGSWDDTSDAGVWFRDLDTYWYDYSWSSGNSYYGFRSAAYGAV